MEFIGTLSWVEFTTVGARLSPFTVTVDPATKFDPVMKSWNAALPARTDFGERLEMAGTGGVRGLIAKGRVVVVPPPG